MNVDARRAIANFEVAVARSRQVSQPNSPRSSSSEESYNDRKQNILGDKLRSSWLGTSGSKSYAPCASDTI